ncbi:MAG: CHAT domain-containing tetratricopeptide repeat protein [Blastocatellia bacterium]
MPHLKFHWLLSFALFFCFTGLSLPQTPSEQKNLAVSAVERLAEALVAAPDEAARRALLAQETALVTSDLVAAIRRLGNNQANNGNPEQALKCYQISLRIAQTINDKEGAAYASHNAGKIYTARKEPALALENLNRAKSLFEETGNKQWLARTLNGISTVYFQQSDYARSLDHLGKAAQVFESIDDREGMATTFGNLGLIYDNQGSYAQALNYYNRALRLYESRGDKLAVADLLRSIGGVYNSLGNQTEALAYYARALPLFESIGDKVGMAGVWVNIGKVYNDQGSYRQALEHFNRALPIFEAAGDQPKVATTLINIGAMHDNQGNYRLGLSYMERVRQVYKSLDDKRGEAFTLVNLGIGHNKLGDHVQALAYYRQALPIFETIGDQSRIAHTRMQLGIVLRTQGNHDQAIDHLNKALTIFEAGGEKGGIALTLHNLGVAYNAQNQPAQALACFLRAASLCREIGETGLSSFALRNAGHSYRQLNQPADAARVYREAISAAEAIRENYAGGEQDAQRLFESYASVYYSLADFLVSQNEWAESFSLIERAKARVLLDVLQAGRDRISGTMSAEERKQEAKLRAELVALNSQVYQDRRRGKRDQARLDDLEKARLAVEDFQSKLYTRHPKLRTERGEDRPLTLPETVALLPDDKTALLEFAVAEDKSFLFVLTSNPAGVPAAPNLKVFALPLKSQDLAARVEKFRTMMQKEDLDFKTEAKALYDLLLKPARAQLQGKTSLVIVPDGPLWELPFQTLVNETGRYLIEEAAISYTPSLTYLRKRYQQQARPVAAAGGLLALGINDFGAQTVAQDRRRLMGVNEGIKNLTAAEPMAKEIGRLYQPQAKVLLGKEATEERFKAEAGNYQVLHLATHGFLDDRSPMYSQIVLAPPREQAKEDGLLEAVELMDLDLNADLAILSACETARGRIGNGEGVIGLMWALFVAGVPATVVSQWSVDDKATEELMVEFHRQLKTKPAQGKAEALRQAALKVMKSQRYPFHWAGFILVGDGR